MIKVLHQTLAFVVIATFLAPATLQAAEQERDQMDFNVSGDNAAVALEKFIATTKLQILYRADELAGFRSDSVRGRFTPRDALNQMLGNIPFEAVLDNNSGALAITRVSTKKKCDADRDDTLFLKTFESQSNNLMIPDKDKRKSIFKALLALAISGSTQNLSAQDEQETEGTDVYTLSPFSVDASKDSGYRATSTLAGSRIRTNLGDVATSISVVTQEFLVDTGATNSEDLLVYTTGTEVVGLGGNYSGGVNIGSGGVPSTGLNGPLTRTRVRGLAGADRTRNYFSSLIEFDSYNTERIEINRGANAALFGLGSPAGIINNALKQASFQDSTEAEFRFGSFGSNRASLDLNRTLIEDTLAVRLVAMHEDRDYEQAGAFTEDKRYFATATFQKDLFENNEAWGMTSLKANYENVVWDENRPRIFPMNDGITQWFDPFDSSDFPESIFDPNAPEGALNGVKPVWDGSTMGTGSLPLPLRSALWVVNPLYRHPVITYDDPLSATPSSPGGVIGRQAIISNLSTAPGTGLFPVPSSLRNAMRSTGNSDSGFYAEPVITDFSIFDFRNNLIDGPTKGEETDFDAYNLSLEQLFFENKFGIEIAFDKQERSFDAHRRIGGGVLRVDPNITLMDGTPNSNFGRAFVSDQGIVIHETDETESFRVTAFGEHDFTENANGWLGKLLGRHILTGLIDSRESKGSRREAVPLSINDNWAGVYGNTNSRLNSNGRKVGTIHYLGESLAGLSSPSGTHLPPIQAVQAPTAATINGGLFRLNDFRDGVFRDVQLNADDRINIQPNSTRKTLEKVDSQALILQSYLLDDILIGTFSWREDEVTAFNAGTAPADPNDPTRFLIDESVYSARFDSDPYSETGDAVSYGAVLKAPQSWVDPIAGVNGLSFHYNESENFQPVGARQTILGAPCLPPEVRRRTTGFQSTCSNGNFPFA